MLRRCRPRRGGDGGILDKLIPGYQARLWAMYPDQYKDYLIAQQNNAFEGWLKNGKMVEKIMAGYYGFANNFKPSHVHRKQTVDWRRQVERGTLVHGRWYEGPYGTNYLPGNTHDRLANVEAPFTDAEWQDRKQYRTFDLMKFTLACFGIFSFYKLTTEVPVVWCEEQESESCE